MTLLMVRFLFSLNRSCWASQAAADPSVVVSLSLITYCNGCHSDGVSVHVWC